MFVLAAALATMLVVPAAGQQAAPLPFEEWRAGLMAEARARGFSDALVNDALAGVEPREQVISEDRNQAEVVQTLGALGLTCNEWLPPCLASDGVRDRAE